MARSALAAAVIEPSDREVHKLLQTVRKLARKLSQENVNWAKALAALLQAGVEAMNGNTAEALRLMARAEAKFQMAEMGLNVALARRWRGQVLGGPEGEKLIASADPALRAQGIVNPARYAHLFIAGSGQRFDPAAQGLSSGGTIFALQDEPLNEVQKNEP
jgi:hypothetical protein